MLAIERRNRILTILREERHVVVSELAKVFDVSEETIRRDLDKLEKEGHVVKTYGGAVISEGSEAELPYVIRKKANVEAKQKIADLAADLIMDGDTLILDASSTAVFIAQKIKSKKEITLITNSIEVLMELSDVTGWKILSTAERSKSAPARWSAARRKRVYRVFTWTKRLFPVRGSIPVTGSQTAAICTRRSSAKCCKPHRRSFSRSIPLNSIKFLSLPSADFRRGRRHHRARTGRRVERTVRRKRRGMPVSGRS